MRRTSNGNTSSSTVQLTEGSGPVINLTSPSKTNLKYTAGTTVLTVSGTVANATDDLTHDDNIASIAWGVTGKNWGATINIVSGTTSYTVANTGLVPTSNFTFDTAAQTFSTTFTVPFISDSSLILTVTATDYNGHTTTSTNYLVANVSGPQLTFYTPTTNVFYSSSNYTPQLVRGNVAVTSPVTLTALQFQLTTATYTSSVIDVTSSVVGGSTGGDFSFSLLATGATLQGHSGGAAVTITAVDSKNHPTVASYNIVEDNTPPTISAITMTSNNTTNSTRAKQSDTVTLSFTINDAASGFGSTAYVPSVTINGGNITPVLSSMNATFTNAVYTATYPVPAGNDGPIIFSITASDVAGNPTTATTVTSGVPVTIDNTPPTVVLSDNHGSVQYVKQGTVNITATFTEGDGINEATPPAITIGTFVTGAAMTKVSNLVWTYAWAAPSGSDGTVADVSITATDLAGNSSAAPTGRNTYTIDNAKPDVALSDDRTSALVKGSDVVNFTATFTEANGISTSPKPTITIGSYGPFTMNAPVDNLHWTYQWTVPTGVSATEAISITATDVAGNLNTAVTGPRLSYIIDNTKPTVVLSDDQTDALVKGNDVVTFTATFTEANGISTSPAPTITIGSYGPYTMSAPVDNLHWTYAWTVPTGVSATEALSITATDVAGNPNTAATGTRLSYIIDNTPPDVALSNDISGRSVVKNPDTVRIIATFTEANGISTSAPRPRSPSPAPAHTR